MAGSWNFQADEAEENRGSGGFEAITIHGVCSLFPRKNILKMYKLSLHLPDFNECEFAVIKFMDSSHWHKW